MTPAWARVCGAADPVGPQDAPRPPQGRPHSAIRVEGGGIGRPASRASVRPPADRTGRGSTGGWRSRPLPRTAMPCFPSWEALEIKSTDLISRGMKLTWQRTVIGGNVQHHDFAAFHGDELVGRIFQHRAGPRAGAWRWTMLAMGPHLRRPDDSHGTAASKAEAAELVAECYAVALARAKG